MDYWNNIKCLNDFDIKIKIMKEKLIVLGSGESGVGTSILAQKKGYDVLEWNYENYYKFFCDNIDKVDLNKNSYRLYFKKLVSYYKSELEKKLKNDE